MKKKILFVLILALAVVLLLAGCGKKTGEVQPGVYRVGVTLSGGSGRASVESPALLTVAEGKMTARIRWSSANYDYMVVDGTKYEAEIREERSEFEIPVAALDKELSVIADTVAMSTPHEIRYTLLFDSATLTPDAG